MRNLRLRSLTALFLLTAANGWTRPVFTNSAVPLGHASELSDLTRGQLPVGMLVRASLATARDLPPGQTATPFAALNAGLDPVSSECLCLKKGNPAINGRGSLGLPSRYVSPVNETNDALALAGTRTAGLTTASAVPLELDPSAETLGSSSARLALADGQDDRIMPQWQLQGESNGRSQLAMASGLANAAGAGGVSGIAGPASQDSDQAANTGDGSATTLEAAPEQPMGSLALGEWKTGPTPDSGLVGVGTTGEPTLLALAASAYLPGAAPVSREAEALSQRIALIEKSYASSVPASDMAPARAPAWGGSQDAGTGAPSGPASGFAGQWAPSVPWQNMPSASAGGEAQDAAVVQIAATVESVPAVIASAAKPAPQEEAVAAISGVDVQMASSSNPVDEPVMPAITVAADVLAATESPEPGTLALVSIGALLVMISQLGKRKKTF